MIDGVYYCRDLSWPSLLGRNIAQAAIEELRVRAAMDRAAERFRRTSIGGRRK